MPRLSGESLAENQRQNGKRVRSQAGQRVVPNPQKPGPKRLGKQKYADEVPNGIPRSKGRLASEFASGRPAAYSLALGNRVCEAVARGKSLASVETDLKLGWQTLDQWCDQFPEFNEKLARARRKRARHYADEIAEIADDRSNDVFEIQTEHGIKQIPNGVAPQRDRLRIGARQWLMERWNPEEFAPPSKLELTGKDGGPVLLEQLTLLAMQQIEAERDKPVDVTPVPGKLGKG